MKSALLIFSTIVAVLLACSCEAAPIKATYPVLFGATTDQGQCLISYRFDQGKLSYAVFIGPVPGAVKLQIESGEDSDGHPWAKLQMRNAAPINLVGSGKLYQVAGDTVTATDGGITESEFEAFLDSKPAIYTVATLLDYIRQHRIKK